MNGCARTQLAFDASLERVRDAYMSRDARSRVDMRQISFEVLTSDLCCRYTTAE
jgi:hypothetical protein